MKSYKNVVADIISDIESVKNIAPDFYAPDTESAKIFNNVLSLAVKDIKNISNGDFEKLTTYLDNFGNISVCKSSAEKHAYQFLYNLSKEKLAWIYVTEKNKLKGKRTRTPKKNLAEAFDKNFKKML